MDLFGANITYKCLLDQLYPKLSVIHESQFERKCYEEILFHEKRSSVGSHVTIERLGLN